MEANSNSSEAVSKPNREFFPQLTSVRFFAAFMVVLYHYEKLIADFFPAPIKNAIHHGFVGVSFFFILSGYILGSNYYDKFSDSSNSPMEKKRQRIDFFWARLARIYPLYLVSILVMVPRVFMNPANDPHPEHIQFFFAHPMWSVLG
ncbi:MAG: acyltransferase, partial [Fimbriimonadaceae bacterium]|nr:acyltransferase [Fimbriimonadaceae bacterium]